MVYSAFDDEEKKAKVKLEEEGKMVEEHGVWKKEKCAYANRESTIRLYHFLFHIISYLWHLIRD